MQLLILRTGLAFIYPPASAADSTLQLLRLTQSVGDLRETARSPDIPKVFKQTYTKPLPAGAEIVVKKGVPHARFRGADGKLTVAPLTRKGDRIRLESESYYGRVPGDPRPVSLECTNETAALIRLGDLTRKAELRKVGAVSDYQDNLDRPLREHLEDWGRTIVAEGGTAKHARQSVESVRVILDGCKVAFWGDLSASAVLEFLAGMRDAPARSAAPVNPSMGEYTRQEIAAVLGVQVPAVSALIARHRLPALPRGKGNGRKRRYPRSTLEALLAMRSQGKSIRTSNYYLTAIKSFLNWMVKDRRAPENPLAHLAGGDVKLDRRHDRRPLSVVELGQALLSAHNSARVFRGLTGDDRYHLYLAACVTGLRAGELASLTPSQFSLDADPPTVAVPAAYSKNRKTSLQPVPTDVAEVFRLYLKDRCCQALLWPGTWHEKAADMLRIDLDAAGIPYVVDGPEGPLFADFHALRHSYIALLDRAGVSLKDAMQLARHSDPKLTAAVYGKVQLAGLGAAVDRLPSLVVAPESPPSEVAGLLLVSLAAKDALNWGTCYGVGSLGSEEGLPCVAASPED